MSIIAVYGLNFTSEHSGWVKAGDCAAITLSAGFIGACIGDSLEWAAPFIIMAIVEINRVNR